MSRAGSLVAGALLLCAFAFGGAPVRSSAEPPPPGRLAQSWEELSPRERGEALRNYQRFQQLPPEQRESVERNYQRWRQLPPQEKERIRGNYREYQKMSPQERRDFQRRYDQWRGGR